MDRLRTSRPPAAQEASTTTGGQRKPLGQPELTLPAALPALQPDGRPLPPATLLQLQRSHGNRAVQRLIAQARRARKTPVARSALPPGALAAPLLIQRKVGFEFQMLESKVKLYRRNQEAEKLFWNNDQTWHIEKDGENIEFVVKPVDAGQAKDRIERVVAVASRIKNKTRVKQDGQKPNSQTNSIEVEATDTGGQPQINADIGLDQFIAPTPGYQKGQDKQNKEYFGAQVSKFNWSYEQTKQKMERVEKVKERMAQFDDEELLDHLQRDVGYKMPVVEAGVGVLKPVLKLMRAYCILEASIRETAPPSKGLTKDMPILPKTNIKSMEQEMQLLLKQGLTTSGQFNEDDIKAVKLKYRFDEIIAELQKASGAGRTTTDFYEETDESRHVFGVKEPKSIKKGNKYGLLMEYRRVPVLPVGEWVAFAQKAAADLGSQDQ